MSSASMELQHPGSFYTMTNRMSSKVPLSLMMPSASSSLSTGSYHSSPSRENGNGAGAGAASTANGHNIIYFLNTDNNNNNNNSNSNNATQAQGCRFPDSSLSLQTRNGNMPEKPAEDGKVNAMNGNFMEYGSSEHRNLQQPCDLNNTLDMPHPAAFRTSSTSFAQGPSPTSVTHGLHPSTTCAPTLAISELHGHAHSTSSLHGLPSPTSNLPPLSTSGPGLIRHTSLPVNVLSRLAMEDPSQTPLYYDSSPTLGNNSEMINLDENRSTVYLMSPKGSLQSMPNSYYMDMGNGGYTNGAIKSNRLIRHSSSPADLLSELSSEEFSHGVDKVSMSSFGLGVHDRKLKRGRLDDINDSKSNNTSNLHLGLLYGNSSEGLNQFGVHGAPSDLAMDLILCKSRAKRGCATHPRSIAERVRRTKISERMRKLQDLVPNLDKQAHIADMLDEVVEYVKNLQQQVQELSTNRCRCKRLNQSKDITSLKM